MKNGGQKTLPNELSKIEQRFHSKYDTDDNGCWRWKLVQHPGGYARFAVNGHMVYAHRWSYEQFVGPIPDGLVIDHLCRNRRCVNPKHLEPVTYSTNTRRGETLPATNHEKTHCAHGHEFTSENTRLYYRPDRVNPRRGCRTCERWAAARQYDKHRKNPRTERTANYE